MNLSNATDKELADEAFLRHPLTQLHLQTQGMTMEEAREKQRLAREA